MKIKIAKNVIHNGKILKEGDVHDLGDKDAKSLIDGSFASEHKKEAAPESKTPPPPPAK